MELGLKVYPEAESGYPITVNPLTQADILDIRGYARYRDRSLGYRPDSPHPSETDHYSPFVGSLPPSLGHQWSDPLGAGDQRVHR